MAFSRPEREQGTICVDTAADFLWMPAAAVEALVADSLFPIQGNDLVPVLEFDFKRNHRNDPL